jgi:hypothetical protein
MSARQQLDGEQRPILKQGHGQQQRSYTTIERGSSRKCRALEQTSCYPSAKAEKS